MRVKTLFFTLFFCSTILYSQESLLEEAIALGEKMEEAAISEEFGDINNKLDKDGFVKRIIIDSDDSRVKNFNEGFLEGFSKALSFYSLVFKQIITQEDEFTFIRAYIKDDTAHLIFRVFGEGGINYHDYELARVGDELKVTDFFIYLSGENISATIQRIYLMTAKGSIGQIGNENVGSISLESVAELPKIRSLVNQGMFEEAQKTMSTLGEEILKEKAFALIDVQIKGNLDEDIYLEALSNYQKNFPNDPSMYLVSIDFLLLQERYDDCLKNIDQLDKAVGGDYFLDFYRGNIKYVQGDLAAAEAYFLAVTIENPDSIDAFDSLLSTYIDQLKNEKAVEILNYFVNYFGVDKSDLKAIMEAEPSYADFRATEAFKNWENN